MNADNPIRQNSEPGRPRSEARTDVIEHEVPETAMRDRIRWGPIVAGVFTAMTTLLVMTVLGLALGLTAFEPGDTGERTLGTAAAVWGIVTGLLAFFLGGWVAGRNALGAPGENGAINGFLVGAATIVVMLWMIGAGLGNLMGLVGANVSEITQVVFDQPITAVTGEEAADAVPVAQENYDAARDSAWGTLAGLVVALAAAAAGGAAGHPDRQAVVTRRSASGRPAAQVR